MVFKIKIGCVLVRAGFVFLRQLKFLIASKKTGELS